MVQRQISYIVPSQGAVGLKDESCDAGVGKDDTADLGTAVNTSEEPLVTVRLACAFIDAVAAKVHFFREYEHGIIIFYQYTYLIIYKNDGSLAFDRLKQFPDEVGTSHAAEALLDVAALVGLVPEEIFALGKLFAWGMG